MKRSGIKRTSPLKRATATLRRSKSLGRTPARARPQRAFLGLSTAAKVRKRQHGLCACGCGGQIAPFPIGFHHILPKAKWPELVDVAENVVGVTADCHANHETRSRPLPREAVSCAMTLTWTAQMLSYFERTYPDAR